MKKSRSNRTSAIHDAAMMGPAYQKRGSEVIRTVKAAVDKAECQHGRGLTLKQFGILIGVPRSTIHDWYYGSLAAPIVHFLCALERVPEDQRFAMLRKLCRDCPRLLHPQLAHDPGAVEFLKNLLKQSAGLSFLSGNNDQVRTFVLTALGNSAEQVRPGGSTSGLDIHRPDAFVPVPGVYYFRQFTNTIADKESLLALWNQIQEGSSDLVFLNGLWNALPEIRNEIVALAGTRNVFVADAIDAQHAEDLPSRGVVPKLLTSTTDQFGRISIHQASYR